MRWVDFMALKQSIGIEQMLEHYGGAASSACAKICLAAVRSPPMVPKPAGKALQCGPHLGLPLGLLPWGARPNGWNDSGLGGVYGDLHDSRGAAAVAAVVGRGDVPKDGSTGFNKKQGGPKAGGLSERCRHEMKLQSRSGHVNASSLWSSLLGCLCKGPRSDAPSILFRGRWVTQTQSSVKVLACGDWIHANECLVTLGR
jgi:hypothetical protein